MSYREMKILKHEHKSPFKIGEEYLEFLDAIGTNIPIMAIGFIQGAVSSK